MKLDWMKFDLSMAPTQDWIKNLLGPIW